VRLFVDTADVALIRRAWTLGVVDGVTTNPSHVARTGRPAEAVYRDILEIVDGPVSLETVAAEAAAIADEGRRLARLHRNVVVKVPLTPEGLKAVKRLAAEGIKTNVTVTFTPTQALLAAKCGATYVSPFVGRLDLHGHRGVEVVRDIKAIYARYGFATQVLAAAVRHPVHVLDAALAGADACTMPFDVLEQLYQHPLTSAAIETFRADWQKVPPP
jgi:transaldolase